MCSHRTFWNFGNCLGVLGSLLLVTVAFAADGSRTTVGTFLLTTQSGDTGKYQVTYFGDPGKKDAVLNAATKASAVCKELGASATLTDKVLCIQEATSSYHVVLLRTNVVFAGDKVGEK